MEIKIDDFLKAMAEICSSHMDGTCCKCPMNIVLETAHGCARDIMDTYPEARKHVKDVTLQYMKGEAE